MANIRKVLLADDDADLRCLGQLSLSKVGGWEVIVAATGEVAVQLAIRELPDLILLDVAMPVMDGRSALVELRREPSTAAIPVIFVTAGVHAEECRALVLAGAVGVVTKPFDALKLPQQLLAMLGSASAPQASTPTQDAIAAQRTAYVAALPARLDALLTAVDQARRGEVALARSLAHKLRGSAGSYGLARLSDAAGRLEEALRAEEPPRDAPWTELDEALAMLHDASRV